jgi:hypothetical protein
MDVIKVIKLTLDNPANTLTTTTKSMLETSVVSLELDKEKELSQEEKNGILDLISYAIDKRVNDKATSLSYTELINLKNKLYE